LTGELRSESTKNGKYTQGRLTRHGYAFAWFRPYFPCVFCNVYRCGRHIVAESANMIATYSFFSVRKPTDEFRAACVLAP
jgi:hypothetical protein